MRTFFTTLCNNDLESTKGHSVIKHMHYDASGSDQSICGILYQVASKLLQLVFWINQVFKWLIYDRYRNNFAFVLP